jgi:hypothetical protein
MCSIELLGGMEVDLDSVAGSVTALPMARHGITWGSEDAWMSKGRVKMMCWIELLKNDFVSGHRRRRNIGQGIKKRQISCYK